MPLMDVSSNNVSSLGNANKVNKKSLFCVQRNQ